MKRRPNPMKIAMHICQIRGIPATAGSLSSIIHSIKSNEVAGVGLTKDKDLTKEFIIFLDGTIIAGQDALQDILTEDGSIYSQDIFGSIEEMQSSYK